MAPETSADQTPTDQLPNTDEEWKQRLDPREFEVLRKHGTEPAFSGEYWNKHDPGTYHCRACGALLFDATTKFDSGTGWPSFWEPVSDDRVTVVKDRSFGMVRVEVRCAKCDSHLGHVFDDGPAPTGQRYCMNSLSLRHDPPAAEPSS